jgi:uncharacterized protein (DUF1499 family)
MGFLGVIVAIAAAAGAIVLGPSSNPWALGVAAAGGLVAAWLCRDSGRWALMIAIIGAVVLGVAVMGVRTEALPLRLALGFGIGAGTLIGLQAILAGLGSLLFGDDKASAVVAILLAAGVSALPLQQIVGASEAAPIHDITTDTDNPPLFVAIAPLRKDAPNPVEYSGPEAAALQKAAYPDIQPVILNVPPADAFAKAEAAAKAMPDWQIVEANGAEGRIEATSTTMFMGFKDDVVIRVAPDASGGSRVDIRSKSRLGKSDTGKNAARIREYVAKLKGQ